MDFSIPENLQEIWLSFEMGEKLGNTVLRSRFVKAVELGKGKGMVAGGFLESWTMTPTHDLKYINSNRVGKLIWKK